MSQNHPLNLRQRSRQRNSKEMKKNVVTTKTAKFERSCMAALRLKGMVFIVVNKPV